MPSAGRFEKLGCRKKPPEVKSERDQTPALPTNSLCAHLATAIILGKAVAPPEPYNGVLPQGSSDLRYLDLGLQFFVLAKLELML